MTTVARAGGRAVDVDLQAWRGGPLHCHHAGQLLGTPNCWRNRNTNERESGDSEDSDANSTAVPCSDRTYILRALGRSRCGWAGSCSGSGSSRGVRGCVVRDEGHTGCTRDAGVGVSEALGGGAGSRCGNHSRRGRMGREDGWWVPVLGQQAQRRAMSSTRCSSCRPGPGRQPQADHSEPLAPLPIWGSQPFNHRPRIPLHFHSKHCGTCSLAARAARAETSPEGAHRTHSGLAAHNTHQPIPHSSSPTR